MPSSKTRRAFASLCASAVLAASYGASPAAAHNAPTGWSYDAYCCGGNDCQPIRVDNVQITADGFMVSIPNGGHATAQRDHRKLFRYDEVRPSEDEHFHACILPNSQEFRCLYVPEFGT